MFITRSLARTISIFAFALAALQFAPAQTAPAETSAPPKTVTTSQKVTQIDVDGLRKVLKPNGRPLVINFWATWCPPCIDEFPDLIKLDSEFRGKVDFVTVSLDDLADISTFVPKFLDDMHSEMPAYLLHTPNDGAAIAIVSKDWGGGLPMTVVYDASGKQVYSKMGRLRVESLRLYILKALPADPPK